jgi:mono/diheme cytochrome c family protein
MDSAKDNPLKRFSSFWLGLIIFAAFGLLSLLLGLGFKKPIKNAYDEHNADRRHDIKTEVDAAHAGAREAAVKSFEKVGANLLAANVGAVEKSEFILPGSALAKEKAAAGNTGIEVPEDFPKVAADAPVDPAMMAEGKVLYSTCLACHGPDANGVLNLGPPLAGSEWVAGPVENLIAIQLRGMFGPIEVKGKTYTPVAPMAPLAFQTDDQIAAVLTYVRNSFGNKASPVTAEQVKAMRGEVGKPMLNPTQLLPLK